MITHVNKHQAALLLELILYLAHSAKTELEKECKTIHKIQATRLHGIQVLEDEVPYLRWCIQQQKLKPFLCDHWAPIILITAIKALPVSVVCFRVLTDSTLQILIPSTLLVEIFRTSHHANFSWQIIMIHQLLPSHQVLLKTRNQEVLG